MAKEYDNVAGDVKEGTRKWHDLAEVF